MKMLVLLAMFALAACGHQQSARDQYDSLIENEQRERNMAAVTQPPAAMATDAPKSEARIKNLERRVDIIERKQAVKDLVEAR